MQLYLCIAMGVHTYHDVSTYIYIISYMFMYTCKFNPLEHMYKYVYTSFVCINISVLCRLYIYNIYDYEYVCLYTAASCQFEQLPWHIPVVKELDHGLAKLLRIRLAITKSHISSS